MASRCSGPVHRIAWPTALQLRKPHQWNEILASLRCISRRNSLAGTPRNHIMLQIRTPTFGFIELLDCRLSTRPPKGHRSFCSLEESSALIPSTRLSKMTCPVACSRSDSGRLLLPQPPSEPLHRRLKEGDQPLKKKY